jgi:hypothetical protein
MGGGVHSRRRGYLRGLPLRLTFFAPLSFLIKESGNKKRYFENK